MSYCLGRLLAIRHAIANMIAPIGDNDPEGYRPNGLDLAQPGRASF
jgi:hypothetical protein